MEIKSFLKPYIAVADMIANTFGEDCEVVVHDLEDPEHSVVYVANNKVTGREIGQSFYTLVSKGIFLMKGSVEKAAEELGVNKVTIYSYLDEIRGKRQDVKDEICMRQMRKARISNDKKGKM